MRVSKRKCDTLIYIAWGLLASIPFFAPIPFYDEVYFGLWAPWLVFGGEGLAAGDFIWGSYNVHFYPKRLVIDLILWTAGLVLVARWVKYLEAEERAFGGRENAEGRMQNAE